LAKTGEILLSEQTLNAAGMEPGQMEKRNLELKGKSAPFDAHVMQVLPS
jgi:class 3 adenylate cyclase